LVPWLNVREPGEEQLVAPWQKPHTLPQVPPHCDSVAYPRDWHINREWKVPRLFADTQAVEASAAHTTHGELVPGSVPVVHGAGGPTQTPCTQVSFTLQAFPHDPQLLVLVSRFVSQPLVRLASQSPNPELQTNPQLDPAHAAAALVRPAQTVPQAAQFCGSVARLVHVPLQLDSPA
jgi:hypothetical protein